MNCAVAFAAWIMDYLMSIINGRHIKLNIGYKTNTGDFFVPHRDDPFDEIASFYMDSLQHLIHRLDGPAITVYNKDMKIMSECHYFMGKPFPDHVPKISNRKMIPKCSVQEIMNIALTFNREYALLLYKIYKREMA
jgi:hypothetical protein